MAMRMIACGCRVSALCPRGHMLRHVHGLTAIYRYRGLRSMASLEAAIRAARPDIIVPCDDRVVAQLHALHTQHPDLRPLIESSLGSPAAYSIVSQRELLLKTAQSLGIRIPETRCIRSEADIHSWFTGSASSAVIKLDGTWGGLGVEIAHSEEEAVTAFHRFSRPPGLGTAIKRLLIDRDPVAIWGWRTRTAPVITIQQFISGRPANAMLACWRGELLGLVSVEVLSSQGATGAAFIVRILDNPEMAEAARLLASRLELTGFYGLDFMLDSATGHAWLIEMNPRCTQLGHLPLPKQGDLAGLLCTRLTGRPCISGEIPVTGGIVAFFPQAISWNPRSTFIRSGYHDVPWEQPDLVRELLLDIWPRRQWLSRLYHHFRRMQAPEAADFSAQDSAAEKSPDALSASLSSKGSRGPSSSDPS
uniref:ATP-grasp domain-containing protein n=2 Tax=Paracidobacterium acidisoli TaxID=2303751 RepID=A0A372IRK2_9BACT